MLGSKRPAGGKGLHLSRENSSEGRVGGEFPDVGSVCKGVEGKAFKSGRS